jgi:Zn-dependent protease
MQGLNLIQQVAIWALPVLFAITVHEVAHGWAARRLGDPTAMMLGRLTLNPLKHIDPVGTVLVPLALIVISKVTGGGLFIFGWAKPVPITAQNLRHPKRDMAWVAIAGPTANLLMAILWALILKLAITLPVGSMGLNMPLAYMADAGIKINLFLMILNLIPIPPLDGSRVVASLLPDHLAWKYSRIEQYGLIILLLMMVIPIGQVNLFELIVGPPFSIIRGWILNLFGIL